MSLTDAVEFIVPMARDTTPGLYKAASVAFPEEDYVYYFYTPHRNFAHLNFLYGQPVQQSHQVTMAQTSWLLGTGMQGFLSQERTLSPASKFGVVRDHKPVLTMCYKVVRNHYLDLMHNAELAALSKLNRQLLTFVLGKKRHNWVHLVSEQKMLLEDFAELESVWHRDAEAFFADLAKPCLSFMVDAANIDKLAKAAKTAAQCFEAQLRPGAAFLQPLNYFLAKLGYRGIVYKDKWIIDYDFAFHLPCMLSPVPHSNEALVCGPCCSVFKNVAPEGITSVDYVEDEVLILTDSDVEAAVIPFIEYTAE
jgi:hypothetical protein